MNSLKSASTQNSLPFLCLAGGAAVTLAAMIWLNPVDSRSVEQSLAAHQISFTSSSRPADREETEKALAGGIELGEKSLTRLRQTADYEAIFSKRERVDGILISQSMDLKLSREPFSLYMRFRSGKERGREVLYVSGAYHGKMLVHERGVRAIAGTLKVDLDDSLVMAENRHQITETGMEHLLDRAVEYWKQVRNGDFGPVEATFCDDDALGPTLQVTHSKKDALAELYVTRLSFDRETKLPVKFQQFGFPDRPGDEPPLVEEFSYSDIRMDVGLTDADFNPRNPAYAFGVIWR